MTHAAAIYLRYEGVGVHELYEARARRSRRRSSSLRSRGWMLSAERRVEDAIAQERENDSRTGPHHTRALHMTLANIAGNRPLALFLDTLISLSDEYSRPEITRGDAGLDAAVDASHRSARGDREGGAGP